MKLALLLVLAGAAIPAFGQHEGHGAQEAPRAGEPAASPDPDAGDAQETEPAADPHAGHAAPNSPSADSGTSPPHTGHDAEAGADRPMEAPPPAEAFSGAVHAADAIFDPREMAEARARLRAEQGAVKTYLVLADRFETRFEDGRESYLWDLQGWYGGDVDKMWLKSEGEGGAGDNPDELELQVLYGRAILPFFDFQAGVRRDFQPGPERTHLVLGAQGLLPQVFEVDAAAFFSEEGDLTARFEAEYDVRITQRLVLQPRMELQFAAQAVPELGVGSGLGSVEAGLRLRYEIRREIAPYIGIGWERLRGDTADIARAAGRDPRSFEAVIGLRSWF